MFFLNKWFFKKHCEACICVALTALYGLFTCSNLMFQKRTATRSEASLSPTLWLPLVFRMFNSNTALPLACILRAWIVVWIHQRDFGGRVNVQILCVIASNNIKGLEFGYFSVVKAGIDVAIQNLKLVENKLDTSQTATRTTVSRTQSDVC